MSRQVFVISDLHLGGEPGFQMCSPDGQALLAQFVTWVTAQRRPEADAHLVLAGDVVDFLAEQPVTAFTHAEHEASRKLAQIFARTAPIWAALAAHVRAGAPLTLMLGNHDIELSMPGPRRALLERLGPGRVEILHDDEALRMGELLVEHGNRYDDWNWVDHDQLRRVRRDISRGAQIPEGFFTPLPGSRFVVDLMNPLKKDFAFVDLLKPEDATVAPFLALLRPGLAPNLRDLAKLAKKAAAAKLRAWAPWNRPGRALEDAPDGEEIDEAITLAEQIASGADAWKAARDAGQRGATWDLLSLLLDAKRVPEERAIYLDKLLTVLRARWGEVGEAFDVNLELAQYHEAAARSAEAGFKAIVYGHTHLVKRVKLGEGATYLNSGTWADVMCVPRRILSADTPTNEAIEELDAFASDLADPARVGRWRRQVPTFARVALDAGNTVREADVYRFRPGASLEAMRVADGQLDALI